MAADPAGATALTHAKIEAAPHTVTLVPFSGKNTPLEMAKPSSHMTGKYSGLPDSWKGLGNPQVLWPTL